MNRSSGGRLSGLLNLTPICRSMDRHAHGPFLDSMPSQCLGEESMLVSGRTRARRCEKPTVGNSKFCADHGRSGTSQEDEDTDTDVDAQGGSTPPAAPELDSILKMSSSLKRSSDEKTCEDGAGCSCGGDDGEEAGPVAKRGRSMVISGASMTCDQQKMFDNTLLMFNKAGEQIADLSSFCKFTQQQVAMNSSTLEKVSSAMQCIGQKIVDNQAAMEKSVNIVDAKVDRLDAKVDSLSVLARREEKGRLFMPSAHTLFNGETGVIGLCPVGYEDAAGIMHNLVVASMPILIWYYAKAKSGIRIPDVHIRSFFGSGDYFMLYPDLPYADFIEVTLRTPFKIRAVGKDGDRNESHNRQNFLVFEGESVKKALAQARVNYPTETSNLRLQLEETKRTHTHGMDGNRIAYTQESSSSKSSGPIQFYGFRNFSMSEKARIPAMGIPWCAENYDLPYVREFFGITKEECRGRHIVGGQVVATSSLVLTHQQEYKKRRKEIERAMSKIAKKKSKTGEVVGHK